MKQMSSLKAIHIILSLPLYSSFQKIVFINTALLEERTFVLKKPSLLQQEPHDSEDIMCASIIDRYIELPTHFEHTCLAEYASSYSTPNHDHRKRKRPYVILYILYNDQKDLDD